MIDGLRAAKEAGLAPIKINMIVLKDINDKKIEYMIDFAKKNNAILQLIELINTNNDFYNKHYFSLEKIEQHLAKKAVKVIKKRMQNRKQYDLGDVKVEVIRPFQDRFCENCTRIRITSDCKIKLCLMRNDNLINFEDIESLQKAIEIKECLV